jgi:hypothetical protein
VDGRAIAFGIAPNGDQTVTITTDRGRVTAPVVANVYYATALHAIRHRISPPPLTAK